PDRRRRSPRHRRIRREIESFRVYKEREGTVPGEGVDSSSAAGPYHWHIEILPRLTGIGGFEWSTGIHINPMPPEAAARALRGDGTRLIGNS
ncbi:MAG: hypothetical protein V3U66_01115, partial [Acidobacteriota bacterium]